MTAPFVDKFHRILQLCLFPSEKHGIFNQKTVVFDK